MRVYVLGSGSTGNAAIVESGGTRVLVDAGFGPRAAAARLRSLGVDLFPRGVDAIVVTHQHGDHIAHAEPLARALRCPLYFHRGIEARRVRNRFDVRDYQARVPFRVGTMTIDALDVPHDAPQVSLRFVGADGRAFGIVTDLGCVRADLVRHLADCDAAIVEANHCPELLAVGPYPPHLKRRVGGDLGHLANEQTAALAGALAGAGARLRRIYLGHLSRANNTPERALAAVRARAGKIEVDVVPHGVPRLLGVPAACAHQLALPFA